MERNRFTRIRRLQAIQGSTANERLAQEPPEGTQLNASAGVGAMTLLIKGATTPAAAARIATFLSIWRFDRSTVCPTDAAPSMSRRRRRRSKPTRDNLSRIGCIELGKEMICELIDGAGAVAMTPNRSSALIEAVGAIGAGIVDQQLSADVFDQ